MLAILFQVFRSPYLIFVSVTALLWGAVGVLDRRVKLTLLDGGIRYAQWGPVVIPWQEFSAYHWSAWRKNPYLQLVPRQPIKTLESFSPLGRLNQQLARIIGVPGFSIAVTSLDVTDEELAQRIVQYLPETI